MSKFTPGPWKTNYKDLALVQAENGAPIARCDKLFGVANIQANARLIAAAPDLLEALQAIVQSLSDQDDEGLIEHAQQMIDARAAIKKATE